MKEKRKTCFRNEIRKSLIVHALAPCSICLAVAITMLLMVGFYQIRNRSYGVSTQISEKFARLMENYRSELKEEQELMIEYLTHGRKDYGGVAEEIYLFLNSQEIRGDYYLFDAQFNLHFSTQTDQQVLNHVKNHMGWEVKQQEQTLHFLYGINSAEDHSEPMWLLFSPLIDEGHVVGYGAFTLPSKRFEEMISMENPSVVIVNRFHRIFAEHSGRFSDDRGKLKSLYQNQNGVFWAENKWYYSTNVQLLNERIKIYTFYDCTFLFHLCSVLFIMVIFLGCIITIAIYITAGRIADKKTEILTEVIYALDQVEQGNLDIKMKISSGDEFERIGQSFNMMLGSIRHLLARHEVLAQDNILAHMQIMEAQFNPHFLFNTLESIRYMISFDRQKAEEMLVGLSRLLCYSIQNASDMVRLEEELDFVKSYLQIMLYRYGSRLSYGIEVMDGTWDYFVPRMLLQPIVENAVKYGYSDKKDKLKIEISVSCVDETLKVTIQDDGCGIEASELEKLERNMRNDRNLTDHIGLYNVNRRIQVMYGSTYGVTIKSEEDMGTIVEIILPVQGKKEGKR